MQGEPDASGRLSSGVPIVRSVPAGSIKDGLLPELPAPPSTPVHSDTMQWVSVTPVPETCDSSFTPVGSELFHRMQLASVAVPGEARPMPPTLPCAWLETIVHCTTCCV